MLKGEPFKIICYLILIALTLLANITYIPVNFQVAIHTITIVYIGSIHSIRLYSKEVNTGDEGVEKLTQRDAWMFPIFGIYLI